MKYFGVLRLCSGFCAQKQAVRTPHLTGCRGLVQIRTSESPLCHIFATNRPSTWLILSERIRVYADFRLTHDGANDSATTATASGLFILRIPWLVDGPGTVSASGCCRDSHHVSRIRDCQRPDIGDGQSHTACKHRYRNQNYDHRHIDRSAYHSPRCKYRITLAALRSQRRQQPNSAY